MNVQTPTLTDTASHAGQAQLGGIIAASLTPVTDTYRIDIDRLEAHLQWLLRQGCTFVSPFGSTGEGPSFSVMEKAEALAALQGRGFDMGKVVPAAMNTALGDTVATISMAADFGCRAVLVVPPYYYGANHEGIAEFFDACATRLGGGFPLEVVLYHIPQMTRAPFTHELISALLERHGASIIGIKDSTGIKPQTLALCQAFPKLRVFTGDDRVLPGLIETGGAGMIGGMPNIVAADLASRFHSGSGLTDEVAVERAARRIETVDAFGGVVALKALKAHATNDPVWSRPMPPLLPLSNDRATELIAAFAATHFDFTALSD